MREWYRIRLQDEQGQEQQPEASTVAEIHIIDFIGDWVDEYFWEGGGPGVVTAKQFVSDLAKLPDSVKSIRVHINSPGGDVFAAVNIANALRDQRASKGRTVETIVDGLAASAASIIVMAGSPVTMADNGLLMIHNAWTIALGNAQELREAADTLDKFRNANIIPTYQWHTELSAEEIAALMDATTWMDADEAIEAGFADEKIEGLRAAAALDPRAMAKLTIPEKYAARAAALATPSAGDREPSDPPASGAADDASEPEASGEPLAVDATAVFRACQAGGLDLEFGMSLVEAGQPLTADQVQARIDTERANRAAAAERATAIRAACQLVGHEDLADDYVAGGMTVDQVRGHLAKITAKLDQVEVDGSLNPDHGTRRTPVIDIAAVYAERNRQGA